jgi:hypothetical protein
MVSAAEEKITGGCEKGLLPHLTKSRTWASNTTETLCIKSDFFFSNLELILILASLCITDKRYRAFYHFRIYRQSQSCKGPVFFFGNVHAASPSQDLTREQWAQRSWKLDREGLSQQRAQLEQHA